jgi:hypothetical protein
MMGDREIRRWGERYMTKNSPKLINNPEYLELYQIAFDTVMTIFEVSQKFPQSDLVPVFSTKAKS